jgi:hypothetical protein
VYIQLHTYNKPFTTCTTRNVISQVQYVPHFYISTFCSMCAVPNMAVFCTSLISCYPGMN